jgi:hypothetical protein
MSCDSISRSYALESLVEDFVKDRRTTDPDSLDSTSGVNLKLSLNELVIPSRRFLVTESVNKFKVSDSLLLADLLEAIQKITTDGLLWLSERCIKNKFEIIFIQDVVISSLKKAKVKSDQVGNEIHKDNNTCATNKSEVGTTWIKVKVLTQQAFCLEDVVVEVRDPVRETSWNSIVFQCYNGF